MGLIKSAVKRFLRSPANALAASSTRLPSIIEDRIGRSLSNDLRVHKYLPHEPGRDSYLLLEEGDDGIEGRDEAGLPIPPRDLWFGYGETPEMFLQSGRVHVGAMRRIANAPDGFRLEDARRVLDFGSGAGRMIRWLNDLAARAEIWGVDIGASRIFWCRRHLSPPFRFATITTIPHLPFEDDYFDFIYAGSVFTHIEDLAEAWLLELRRVVRPGGRLYLTVHDAHTIELLTDPRHADKLYPNGRRGAPPFLANMVEGFEEQSGFSRSRYQMFTIGRGPVSQVFYDIDFLREHWGRFLPILSVNPEAYGYQTAVLLEKRPAR